MIPIQTDKSNEVSSENDKCKILVKRKRAGCPAPISIL